MRDILDPEFDRRLLLLRHELHWSIRRIARWLGVSTGKVSQRLNQLHLQQTGFRYARRPLSKRRMFRPRSISNVFDL